MTEKVLPAVVERSLLQEFRRYRVMFREMIMLTWAAGTTFVWFFGQRNLVLPGRACRLIEEGIISKGEERETP